MSHRMSSRGAAALALLAVLALAGCQDEDEEPIVVIQGTVLDTAGSPVAGAGVLLEYHFDPFKALRPTTRIQFSVPAPTWVKVWLTAPCEARPVRVLQDGLLQSGAFELAWDGTGADGKLVVPGVYTVHIQRNGFELLEWNLIQPFWSPSTDLAVRDWHAMTNGNGRYSIPVGCLSFGAEVYDVLIPWEVRVHVVHPDHGVASAPDVGTWLPVDPDTGAQQDLQFPD